MCAIAGCFQREGHPLNPALLNTISESLRHRGPDGQGFLAWSPGGPAAIANMPQQLPPSSLSLMHRRLSILDLSESGSQPMMTPDGRYSVVFNGEIYNYLELRTELKAIGHVFNSHSDTEVLLAAYIAWGTAALTRFVGMFAFAILDTQARSLFLGRDCFGIKPLYYTLNDHHFAFASEIPALLTLPSVGRQINSQASYHYLHSSHTDHSAATLFADIHQLLPAHYLHISLNSPIVLRPQRYWEMALQPQATLSFDEAAQQLKEHFLKTVRLHLRSDVPVGAALSGGIDSSAIVMAMRHLQGDALNLHSFSYVASSSTLSEERWIDQVGQAAGAVLHKVKPELHGLASDLNTLITAQGEPFRSTSIYAQYRVFQLAKDIGIKVMLDGQGADELLGGYRPYLGARLASLLMKGHYVQALQFIRRTVAALSDVSEVFLLSRAGGLMLPEKLQDFTRWLVGQQRFLPWLDADWIKQNNLQTLPLRLNQHSSVLKEQLYRATTQVSVPQLLRYEDRNSMAHSIESRVPFLTTDLAEFLLSLPESYLIGPAGTSKRVFRAAMRGIVPDAVLDRQDKIGFATPEYDWLLEHKDWFWEVLNSDRAREIPIWNLKVIHREFEAIVQGRQKFDYRVWRWVNFILWAECFDVTF